MLHVHEDENRSYLLFNVWNISPGHSHISADIFPLIAYPALIWMIHYMGYLK